MKPRFFIKKKLFLSPKLRVANFCFFLTMTLAIATFSSGVGSKGELFTVLPSSAIAPSQSMLVLSQANGENNNGSTIPSIDKCSQQASDKQTNTQTTRDSDGSTRKKPKRGDESTLIVVSPKTSVPITDKRPTIYWCAAKDATSYTIYLQGLGGKKFWKKGKLKEDSQGIYPNLLYLPYPNDEPALQEERKYMLIISAKNNKSKNILSRAKEIFIVTNKGKNN